MRNGLKKNTRIKIIALLSAILLWMYVMAIVDPEDKKLFENIPVTITNEEQLEEDNLVVYPESDLVADIYITGKLSYLQKITQDDIHIYGTINNPIEGKNYLYLKVNTNKQVSYEFKSDFIVLRLEKIINQEKEISTNVTGKYKDDIDTVVLQQNSVNISGPRVLVEQVSNIEANIQVDNNDEDLNQRVKLVPVNKNGDEVKGITLDTKVVNAKVSLLEEKEVPIKMELDDKLSEETEYEISENSVTLRGKKDILGKIEYVNTEKIDPSSIGVSKKVNLVIPDDVTSNIDTVVVKSKKKEKEDSTQSLIYSKDEIELRSNSQEIESSNLNIPDNIKVEVELDDKDTKISKSDIKLYIDLDNSYDDSKKYTINYETDIKISNIKIIPNTIG